MSEILNTSDWNITFFTASSNSGSISTHKTLEWKIKLAFNIAFLVVGSISNSLVVIVTHSDKTKRRTPHEHFICNLSVSDIVCIIPVFVFTYLKAPDSLVSCTIAWTIGTAGLNVILYSVSAIAFFRARAILNPFKGKPSKKCIYGTIAGIWALATVYVIPLYIVLKTDDSGSCYEDWPSQIYNKVYTVFLTVVQYVIPLTIMAVSYTKIVLYLKRHKVPQCGLNNDRIKQMRISRKRDMEVIKISVIILLLYTILTVPGQIAWIGLIVFGHDVGTVLLRYSNETHLLYSCCNPFVYGTISRPFRNAFFNFFTRRFPRKSKRQKAVITRQQGRVNQGFQELDVNKASKTASTLATPSDTKL